MSGNQISFTEHTLHDVSELFQSVGIPINSQASYTITNTDPYIGGGSLQFVVNGKTQDLQSRVVIKGTDIHRLAIRASEATGHYQRTQLVVTESIGNSSKEYEFIVSSEKTLENNQAPAITIENKLIVGENKATDLIRYEDPEGHTISTITVSLTDDTTAYNGETYSFEPTGKKDEIELIFDGVKLGNSGSFDFTPRQLNWLKFYAPVSPLRDTVSIGGNDSYGALNYGKTINLTIGK